MFDISAIYCVLKRKLKSYLKKCEQNQKGRTRFIRHVNYNLVSNEIHENFRVNLINRFNFA